MLPNGRNLMLTCVVTVVPLLLLLYRALLVEEVGYEPSSLLKKSRKAVVLITGADLVLVKITSMTKASSSTGNGSTSNANAAAAAADGVAAAGTSSASQVPSAAAAAAGASAAAAAGGGGRVDSGLDVAAAVAADSRASVLAQHELNKVG